MRKFQGFSLLELLVTILVGSVIAAIAIPNMGRMLVNQRLDAQARDFVSALMLTRSEAVKRNGDVFLIAREISSNAVWGAGVVVVSDSSRSYDSCIATPDDECLGIFQPSAEAMTVTLSNGADEITYGKSGRADDTPLTLTICPSASSYTVSERIVNIGATGIPTIAFGDDC